MFSAQGQIANVSGFAAHTVCVTATQFCCCYMTGAIDNMYMHGRDPVYTFYLQTLKYTFHITSICHELFFF